MIDEDIITKAVDTITQEDRPEPVVVGGSALGMDVWLKQFCEAQSQDDSLNKCQELNLV